MGITTAVEVNIRKRRGEIRALQEGCCSTNVVVPADMIAVVALAERSLDLECSRTK